jgi:hypothetical protein
MTSSAINRIQDNAKPNGDVCDGRAYVETVYDFGKTLISKIKR